jgi:hypothetical protein
MLTCRFNFFKDLLEGAFENDPNLSSTDRRKGQLEGPNSVASTRIQPTQVQRAWRERQTATIAPVAAELLENTKWKLELYLAGIPEKDPSNDLYGSRVNISNRNKEFGLDLPQEPTTNAEIEFLPGGVCCCQKSPFTSGADGEWKLSEDGTQLRFSLDVVGYSRTVQTKGSIQKVFWSEQPEATRKTASSYNIPPGWVYCDIRIGYGSRPGTIDPKGDGVLRVEQRMGLMGAASKLVACGKVVVTAVPSEAGKTTVD